MSTQLIQLFSVHGEADVLFQQAEALMDALMDLEDNDASITDSDVSVDADLGEVTVAVYTASDDRAAAEPALLGRIGTALAQAGIKVRNEPVEDASGFAELERKLQFA